MLIALLPERASRSTVTVREDKDAERENIRRGNGVFVEKGGKDGH